MSNKRKENGGKVSHIDILPEWFDKNGFLTGALEIFNNKNTRPEKGSVLVGSYILPWGIPHQSFPISGTCESDKALWVDSMTPAHLKVMSVQITDREIIQQTYFNLWGNNVVDVEDLFPAKAFINEERIDVRIIPAHITADRTTFRHSVELWSRYWNNGQLEWRIDRTTAMKPFLGYSTRYAPSHLLRYMHTLTWEMNGALVNVISNDDRYSAELVQYARELRELLTRLESKKHTGKAHSPAGIFVTEAMANIYPNRRGVILKVIDDLRQGRIARPPQLRHIEVLIRELINEYDTMRGVHDSQPSQYTQS